MPLKRVHIDISKFKIRQIYVWIKIPKDYWKANFWFPYSLHVAIDTAAWATVKLD